MTSSFANLEVAKASFVESLSQFASDKDRRKFLDWIVTDVVGQLPTKYGNEPNSEIEYQKLINNRNILRRVSEFVKDRCVIEASQQGCTENGSIWNSDKLHLPASFSVGGDADTGLSLANTIHLDSFLYDEAYEDKMIESGKLTRAYCKGIIPKNTLWLMAIIM